MAMIASSPAQSLLSPADQDLSTDGKMMAMVAVSDLRCGYARTGGEVADAGMLLADFATFPEGGGL